MSGVKNKGLIFGVAAILWGSVASASQPIVSTKFVLYPSQDIRKGPLGYDEAFRALSKFQGVRYGEPILVAIDDREKLADLSVFDELVIRVSLEELMAQPNRVEPNDGN